MREPSQDEEMVPQPEIGPIPEWDKELVEEYFKWKTNKTKSRAIKKPNAGGKLWKKIQKRETEDINTVQLSSYDKKKWLTILDEITQELLRRKFRFHFNGPTTTPFEKIQIEEMLNFLSLKYPDNDFRYCDAPQSELRNQEKTEIIKESHGSVMVQHYGENKTVERARTLGEWRGMENEIIDFMKKCPTCQLQKTIRITRRVEAIIPDTPTQPNEKIAMDIFGPLPKTIDGHEYTLSIQDMLTKYLMLIPLKNAQSESIIEGLFDHFIYIYSDIFGYIRTFGALGALTAWRISMGTNGRIPTKLRIPTDIASRPILNMVWDKTATRYLFVKKYRISLSTREEWTNGEAYLPSDGDNWFTDGSKNKEKAGAGLYLWKGLWDHA